MTPLHIYDERGRIAFNSFLPNHPINGAEISVVPGQIGTVTSEGMHFERYFCRDEEAAWFEGEDRTEEARQALFKRRMTAYLIWQRCPGPWFYWR